jgi:hypothetical protein
MTRRIVLGFRTLMLSLSGIIIATSLPLVGVAMGASVATAGFGLRERLRRSGMSWPLVVVGLVMIVAAVVRTLTAEPFMPHPTL